METGKVVIYCRVSSKKQVKEGNGLDSQESVCRTWAKQHGYTVVNVFQEKGISGSEANRPALTEMISFLLDANEKYTVLAYDLNRFARDKMVYFAMKQKIIEMGHCLQTVSIPLDNSEESDAMEGIAAIFSELERKKNKRRTIINMQDNAKNGYWIMQPPTGYKRKRINGKLHLVRLEPTATYINNALCGFATGRFLSQKDVYDFLADKQILNYCERPVKITLNFVKNMLTNDKYTGIFAYPHWNIPRQKWAMEPIIDTDIFQAIQDRLNGRKTVKPKKYNYNDERFPLRRWVRCATCGDHLTASCPRGKAGISYPTYHCHNSKCPMCGKSIKQSVIHADFERMLSDISASSDCVALAKYIIKEEYNNLTQDYQIQQKQKLSALESKKADKERVFNLMLNASAKEVIDMCNDKIAQLTADIAVLEREVAESKVELMPLDIATDYVIDFISKPLDIWRSGDYRQKQCVLNLCFDEHILYDRDKKFGTPKLTPIFKLFSENTGDSNSWRALQDSNLRPAD